MNRLRFLVVPVLFLLLTGPAGAGEADSAARSPVSLVSSGMGSPITPATAIGAGATVGTAFYTTTLSIPTYPYAAFLTPAYNPTYNMTFSSLDWGSYAASHPTPVPQDYVLLVMENAYLQVSLLPELGGRVYQMIYKATGNNELYRNPVIKPTSWGPPEQGGWLAVGGIEWCLPVDEHGYEWGVPWSWSVVTSTVGVTVTVRDTLAADRLRAAVDLFLPADRGALVTGLQVENPTASAVSFKYWTNAMLAPGPGNHPGAGLTFAFDADLMAVHSTGDGAFPCAWQNLSSPSCLFTWPVYAGRDFSRLGNWHEWLGFFAYPQAAADFAGVYDPNVGEGVARVFPAAVARGTKGFAFGWSNPIDWHNWTDDGSAYVELHGGLAPTFWDTETLAAGQAVSWTEVWYPVGNIGGISDAASEAALGVQAVGDRLDIGVHSTVARAEGESVLYVWDTATCAELGHRHLPAVDPAISYRVTVPAGGRSLDQVTVAYLDDQEVLLAGVNPTDCLPPHASVNPLPPWVATAAFDVDWAGWDNASGVTGYDVQVRDGYEGAWTDWLTDTTALSATFPGTHGHTYTFRARARDGAGNEGAFEDSAWGQAFTTVLTTPAPVLVTSRKDPASRFFALDQSVLYTLLVSNTGSLMASVVLTDALPIEMVLLTGTMTATVGSAPVALGGEIHWQGDVGPGAEARLTYVLSPTASTPLMVPLTNTVEISGSVLGRFARQAVVWKARISYLPLVMRNG